eukprot:m.59834 g.59834  ORF g.59834 m.59834 type:complete len:1958 (+) comp15721_c0_seq1:82-5955(+)
MSDILCRWLNEEVHVSKHVDRRSFSGAFASGLLFGEVLHKHGLLQEEFAKFLPGTSSEAKLRNFKLLLPTLRLLAIPMKANIAHDIMIGKAGVAQDVVYQLYSALSDFDKQAFEQRKLDTRKSRRESVDDVFYDRLLTGKTPRQTDLNMRAFENELEAKRAATEEKIRERDAKAQARLEQQTRAQMRLMHERSQLKKKQYDDRIAAMEAQYQARAAALGVDPNKKRMSSLPKTPPTRKGSARDVTALPDRPISRDRLQPLDLTGVSTPSSRHGIRTSSRGLDTASNPGPLGTPAAAPSVPPSKPESPSRQASASASHTGAGLVDTIRNRKQEMEAARAERSKRRQRALVREAKLRSEHDAQERHSLLLSKLLRTSREERRIAVELTNRRDEERVIRENRVFRDRQRKERLRKDFEEALQREADLARQQNIENADEIERRAERLRKIAEDRALEEQAVNRRFVTSLVDQLVDLSTKCGEAREVNEGKLPAAQYREWKALVLQGVALYAPTTDAPTDGLPTPDDVLNDLDYHNYVHVNEPWRALRADVPRTSATAAGSTHGTAVAPAPTAVDDVVAEPAAAAPAVAAPGEGGRGSGASSPTGTDTRPGTPPEQKVNRVLGHVVHRIRAAARPPPRAPVVPTLPPSRVRAAVIGKPFSGRTQAVRAACAQLGAVVVSPTELLEAAIAAHEAGETVEQYCDTYGLPLPDAAVNDATSAATHGVDTAKPVATADDGTTEAAGAAQAESEAARTAGTEDGSCDPADGAPAETADNAAAMAAEDVGAIVSADSLVEDATSSDAAGDGTTGDDASATNDPGDTGTASANDDPSTVDHEVDARGDSEPFDSEYHVLNLRQCPSEHAALGQQAHEHIQRGAAVPTAVVVRLVVLAIQRIDATKGWVLDNFPTTRAECVLLEKILTGYDEDQPDPFANMSTLAPVAADERISPQAQHSSALAAVVCLDVDDTTCIRRAEGRRIDPDTGVLYHLEGLGLPLPPAVPAAADVPADVTTADDVLGVRDRLVPVEDVFASQAHLHSVLDRWAQHAPAVAEWYAQWNAYRVVDASTYNDELAASLHRALVEVSETEEREAEAVAAALARADTEAHELLAQAEVDVAEQDTIEHALATELEADTAALARQADEARLAAEAEERAASGKGKKKKPKSGKKGKGGGGEDMPEGADLEALIQREQDEAAKQAAVAAVPAVPGAAGYAYHSDEQFVDLQLALALDALWQHTEESYAASLKLSLGGMRTLRDALAEYLHEHRVEFADFLTRPDTKQEYVSLWQQAYNAVAVDMRDDPATKAELHMRSNDLYDTLMDICDKRREEAEADLHAVRTSGYAQDHLSMLANLYTNAIKAEEERYCDTNTLLGDFYAAAMERCINDATVDAPPLHVVPTVVAGQSTAQDAPEGTPATEQSSTAADGADAETAQPPVEVPGADVEAEGPGTNSTEASAGDGGDGAPSENDTVTVPEGVDSSVVTVVHSDGPCTVDSIKHSINSAAEKALGLMVARRDPKEARAEEAAAEAAAKEKEEKAKKKPKKGEVVEEPLPPTAEEMQALEQAEQKRALVALIDDERHVAVVAEDERFKARVELLRTAALHAVENAWAQNVALWDHITTCTTLRYNTEVAAVSSLKRTAQEAIEAEKPLAHELILDNDAFVVDKHVFMYTPPQPDPDAPPPEEPTNPARFTVAQLTRLSCELEQVCPDFSMPTATLTRLLHGLCTVATGNTLVPAAWHQLALATVGDVVGAVAHGVAVDWRQFVIAALQLPPPTAEQWRQALQLLRDTANEHGDIDVEQLKDVPMWFDDAPTEENPVPRVFHRGRAVKHLLGQLLGVNGTVAVVDIGKWLCRMPHPRDALVMALSLARGDGTPDHGNGMITVDEACEVLRVDASVGHVHPPQLPTREFLFPLWHGQTSISLDVLLNNDDVASWVDKFFGVVAFEQSAVVSVAGSATTTSSTV